MSSTAGDATNATSDESKNNGNSNGNGQQQKQHQAAPLQHANVHVSEHPLLSHKITKLRSSGTSPASFRAVLREITYHLGFEATSGLTTERITISVPMPSSSSSSSRGGGAGGGGNGGAAGTTTTHVQWDNGRKMNQRVCMIPILRSGLGMVDSMLELLPNSAIHHIGMYKQPQHFLSSSSSANHHPPPAPVQYYNRLPKVCNADVAYVLDCIISTSSTVTAVLSILKKWGVPQIHVVTVIAARPGVERILQSHPDVHITAGTIDDTINEEGFVWPGLGDAGDRLFGTVVTTTTDAEDDNDGDDQQRSSKRKRTHSF